MDRHYRVLVDWIQRDTVKSIESGVILVSGNPAQFSGHGFFCLHTEETDWLKVDIVDPYPFKAETTFVLNHIV